MGARPRLAQQQATATAPCHRSSASITADARTRPPAADHPSPAFTNSAGRTASAAGAPRPRSARCARLRPARPPAAPRRRSPRPSRGRRPRDLVAAQRVAVAIGLQQRGGVERQRALEGGEQALERRLEVGRASGRACRAVACSSGGSSSTRSATLTPMPSTAQPSCGRPSARMPATLRPSTSTSLGHLITRRGAGDLGDGERRGERQQRRRVAQDERQQQRAARAAPTTCGPGARARRAARRR